MQCESLIAYIHPKIEKQLALATGLSLKVRWYAHPFVDLLAGVGFDAL
jgi:hypothetical protein